MKTTQQRHAQRIQRVIDHIHEHSAEEIDSATVADVAQLSAYHWHRIYVAVTGESAVRTLRRVRLEKAATALLRDDRPIVQIASECGFDNLQSFTRLFSRIYGLPPGRFRAKGVVSHGQGIMAGADQMSSNNAGEALLTSGAVGAESDSHDSNAAAESQAVNLVERTALRLVGLWHEGDYNEIGRVFEKVMAAAEIESWPRSEAFTVGVYFDDPDVVPLKRCRSFAGVPVPMDFQVPAGYDTQQVSGGLHASYLHTGPYALLPDSYRWLYRKWLRTSVQEARDIPCHEVYLNAPYNTAPAKLETLVCLPLAG